MGICKICGKSAGLLRSVHPECKRHLDELVTTTTDILAQAVEHIVGGKTLSKRDMKKLGTSAELTVASMNEYALVQAREECLTTFVQELKPHLKGAMEFHACQQLWELLEQCIGPTPSEIIRRPVLRDLQVSYLASSILEGEDLPALVLPEDLPIALKKMKVISLFESIDCFQAQVERRQRSVGTRGSVRLSKNVRISMGGQEQKQVERRTMRKTDAGSLAICEAEMIFVGSRTHVVPYGEIADLHLVGFVHDDLEVNGIKVTFLEGDALYACNPNQYVREQMYKVIYTLAAN